VSNIDETLAERGTRYGDFRGHAKISQGMKKAMRESGGWDALSSSQKEALEMVVHKIGRILNGDPNYHDSWHDIIGYTRLVEEQLSPFKNASDFVGLSATAPSIDINSIN
jgi:hypothetical protein